MYKFVPKCVFIVVFIYLPILNKIILVLNTYLYGIYIQHRVLFWLHVNTDQVQTQGPLTACIQFKYKHKLHV